MLLSNIYLIIRIWGRKMITLAFWYKVVLYTLVLVSIYIFVKTSKWKRQNRPLIPLAYRIFLALFFPLIFVLAILIGSIVLAVALVILALMSLSSLVSKKKIIVKKYSIIKEKTQ